MSEHVTDEHEKSEDEKDIRPVRRSQPPPAAADLERARTQLEGAWYVPRGWPLWDVISSAGALLLVVTGVMLIYNVVRSHEAGAIAGDNPWNPDSLEWPTTSPPPVYNFLEIPIR